MEGGKYVSLYHPLHEKPIGYGLISGGGKSLRRMFHVHVLFNGPVEDLVVIGNFRAETIFNNLDCPFSSGSTTTDPEEIHPTVVGEIHKGYNYPWHSCGMKSLSNNSRSSIS